MDFRYLDAFLCSVDTPTLSLAARQLKIAPSALTRQLQLFEQSVGVQLFERRAKSVRPTSVAHAIAKSARAFVADAQQAMGQTPQQLLRLRTLEGGLFSFLIPVLNKLRIPDSLNLDIQIDSTRNIVEALKNGNADAGIVSQKIELPGIAGKLIMSEQMVLIFHKPIELSDVHKERWIYVFEGSYLQRISKVEPKSSLRVESLRAVIELVEAKLGLAVVPARAIPKKSNVFAQPIESLQKEKLFLCWRKDVPAVSSGFLNLMLRN